MPEMKVEELPGVGAATAEKLKEAGYTKIMQLAVESPKTLAELTEIGEAVAAKIIAAAKKNAEVGGFETGDVVLERRKTVTKLTTCSKAFNDLMGGGFETQSIVEMFGEFGSGKTQIAHQCAVTAQLPEDKGGLDSDVIMIDTENTFRPERIVQMATALEMDPEEALKRIHLARASTSTPQMIMVQKS